MAKIKLSASRTPTVATEFRFGRNSERAVGANGELNASSKKDLWNQVMAFTAAASSGQVISESAAQQAAAITKRNRELLAAAQNDPKAHRLLGEKMAESLYITGDREGFARLLLTKVEVPHGSIPRFPVRMKNVTAMVATSPTKVQPQIVRDKWLTPPEVQLIARPFVPENEINQSQGDVLAEKFVEAQEALMVTEDRMVINMANRYVGLENDLSIVVGQLTPFTLMQVANNVTRWGLKTPYCLMASDFMQDFIGNSEFYSAMDPVARHELLLTGQIAVAYGMTVISDAYRHPEHKVLNRGEFFVFADALTLGAYSDRGAIKSDPISILEEKIAGRGWVMRETWASALTGGRAVAKGLRV